MTASSDNWKTQIRKGYLELCILLLIRKYGQLYGFDLNVRLSEMALEIKEGTLYPLLNRMSSDGSLTAHWDTENVKGHPRKFYAVTKQGDRLLEEMSEEFKKMVNIYERLSKRTEKSIRT